MILSIQYVAGNCYRAVIKKDTAKKINLIKKGMQAYFYFNEHGMFIKFRWPNVSNWTNPKDPIVANVTPIAVNIENPDFFINSTEACRKIREIQGLTENGPAYFDLIYTGSIDTFRIKFIEQRSKREIKKDKNITIHTLPSDLVDIKTIKIPETINRNELIEAQSKIDSFISKKNENKISKETLIKILTWNKNQIDVLLTRAETVETEEEINWLLEDSLNNFSKTLERLK